jgi:hypothetical protein
MRRFIFIALATLVVACSSSRNSGGRVFDAVTVDNETWQLKNDTLYSSSGLKFFIGQKLAVGSPAADDGYYRSIIYRNAAIVPSIWGQDRRYDHAIENHVNVKKSREVVKQSLIAGKTVTIKGIGLLKGSKPNFYIVSIASETEVLNCDIQFALSLKELSLP